MNDRPYHHGNLRTALLAFSHAAPDFAHFNYRDAWHAGPPSPAWIADLARLWLAYEGTPASLRTL